MQPFVAQAQKCTLSHTHTQSHLQILYATMSLQFQTGMLDFPHSHSRPRPTYTLSFTHTGKHSLTDEFFSFADVGISVSISSRSAHTLVPSSRRGPRSRLILHVRRSGVAAHIYTCPHERRPGCTDRFFLEDWGKVFEGKVSVGIDA